MRTVYPLILGAVLLTGCSSLPRSDAKGLQGAWEGQGFGETDSHKVTFVIAGSSFEFRDQTEPRVWYKGTFALREDTTPHQFLATITECPFDQYTGKTSVAIYRLEGQHLTLTGNEPGKPEAPVSFDAPGMGRIEMTRK